MNTFTSKKKYQNGFWSLICLTIITITSLQFVRRRYYLFFKISHYSFIGFYVFGCLHAPEFATYTYISLALYATDILMRYSLGLFPQNAYSIDVLPGEVVRVRFPKHKFRFYSAGQYVFLNFPRLSFPSWHPFPFDS